VVALKSALTASLLSNPNLTSLLTTEKGVLVSGKGTRFILANTEQLHSKIQEMSDRIRNLEEGLQAIHSEHAPPHEPHPLMQADLLGIKSTMGLYSAHEDRPVAGPHQSPSDQLPDRSSSEDTVMAPENLPDPVQVSKIH
jgi:hypothetical protein